MSKEKTVYERTYHKIPNLWEFDTKTKIFEYGEFSSKELNYLQHSNWLFTEKVDGMNFRIIWDGYTLTYKGRTENSEFIPRHVEFIETHLVNEDIEQAFEQLFKDKEVIVYGELYGFDIQKAGKSYNPDSYEFRVFDININNLYLERKNVEDIAHTLGYDIVPIAFYGCLWDAIEYVETQETSLFSKAIPEGLVGVPTTNLYNRLGERIIVKVLPKHTIDYIKEKELDYERRHKGQRT